MIERVVSTISSFASVVSSADHYKTMNGELLQLMRADNSGTRLAAIKCQRQLTDSLGEDWLALLPEMLPFITELLEDDDEKVERETRLWMRSVEETIGESLEGMLQ
jgi:U3 small nucleolar RNA-associated protein 10